jgi:hypothetical protein
MGELVDADVIPVVGVGEAFPEGGDGQDDRAPPVRLADQVRRLEGVVAVEAVGRR